MYKTKQQRAKNRCTFVVQFNTLRWSKECCPAVPQHHVRETFTQGKLMCSLMSQHLWFISCHWTGSCLLWKRSSHLLPQYLSPWGGEKHDEASWVYARGVTHTVFFERGYQPLCFGAGQRLPRIRFVFFLLVRPGRDLDFLTLGQMVSTNLWQRP